MTPEFLIVDLFCGAGGVSTGFSQAVHGKQKLCKVIACVNHDALAISSHAVNHKGTYHFTEDIRTLDLTKLVAIAAKYRKLYPTAKLILWASLECTNFSKAKGGMPRNADSRTLAEHLFRYRDALNPDYIQIENVEEFMSWGPLDEHGKPISKRNGEDYSNWVAKIKAGGFDYDFRILNAADFGAYTSRKRYFGCFAKYGLPTVWPAATHAKKPMAYPNPKGGEPTQPLMKWKAVRDVLDLNDKGNSIFNRVSNDLLRKQDRKELSEKTLARIYAGLIKFVAGGKDAFMLKYNSINKETGKHVPPSVDEPCPTIAAQARLGVVQPEFIAKYYSGRPEGKVNGIDEPAGTIRCSDGQALIQPQFISEYYSGKDDSRNTSVENPLRVIPTENRFALMSASFIKAYHGSGSNCHSVDGAAPTICGNDGNALVQPEFIVQANKSSNAISAKQPCNTIATVPKFTLVQPQFIAQRNNGNPDSKVISVDGPARTLTATGGNQDLISAEQFIMDTAFGNTGSPVTAPLPTITANRKHHYLMNPQYMNAGGDVNTPCFTLIARMDKMPPYLVTTEDGYVAIEIAETDSEFTIKIKEFMAMYGIYDIKMRMLRVAELLRIQGFPADYVLHGSQADQKKFIGNSVVPLLPKVWAEALAAKLVETVKVRRAA